MKSAQKHKILANFDRNTEFKPKILFSSRMKDETFWSINYMPLNRQAAIKHKVNGCSGNAQLN